MAAVQSSPAAAGRIPGVAICGSQLRCSAALPERLEAPRSSTRSLRQWREAQQFSAGPLQRRGVARCGVAEPGGVPAPMGQRTRYTDSWFDVAFMKVFGSKMENVIEGSTPRPVNNYDDFVETSRRVMRGRSPTEQREIVGKVLLSLLPPNAPATFRRLFPPTKWSAELNAFITVPFFQWLVGPAQLKEVEVNGVKQWSGVQITKCRYLEVSGCVGMCVNMCKLPTQDFFTDQFGLPLTMTPNYEDMSCEMIFGQMPPPLEEDPALQQQPCYKGSCPMANPEAARCPTLISP